LACAVSSGQRVSLVSQDLDPDVFLWDSRDGLMQYAQGDYSVRSVLRHTTLVNAYSTAIVIGCRGTQIHPPYASDAAPYVDVVAVRILSGLARGRYGWVLSTDVRRPDGSVLSSSGQRR